MTVARTQQARLLLAVSQMMAGAPVPGALLWVVFYTSTSEPGMQAVSFWLDCTRPQAEAELWRYVPDVAQLVVCDFVAAQ